MTSKIERLFHGSQATPVASADVEAGDYVLNHDGNATAAIPFDATAATIEGELEGLASIGSGNIAVADTANGRTFTYQGALADTDVVEDFTASSVTLKQKADTITLNVIQEGETPTPCVPSINTITSNIEGANAIQQVDLGGATTGTFYLDNGVTSGEVTSLDASGVQAACDTVWGSGNTSVTGSGPFDIEFIDNLALQEIEEMTVTTNTTDGSPTVTQIEYGSTPVSQVDEITFDSVAVAGTMTIDGYDCDWDEDASTAVTISGATISATTPASGSIEITWNDYQYHPSVAIATSTLVSTIGQQEIYTITLSDGPEQGSVRLRFDPPEEFSSSWEFNADAATVEAAIQSFSGEINIPSTVTGDAGGPWQITCTNNDVSVFVCVEVEPLRKSVDAEIVTVQEGEADNPTIVSLSPTDDATDVSPTTNLVITFSAAVDAEAGAANNIDIHKASDDSLIESIDAQDGKVTGGGTDTITIDPEATLEAGVGYYVLIGEDAFDDLDSNSFAGISDKTVWNFTIAAEGGGDSGSAFPFLFNSGILG